VCRGNVPAKEKTEMLGRLGEIFLKEGAISVGSLFFKQIPSNLPNFGHPMVHSFL
jgi:hypothetical protein